VRDTTAKALSSLFFANTFSSPPKSERSRAHGGCLEVGFSVPKQDQKSDDA
jgi:hypothetical protein